MLLTDLDSSLFSCVFRQASYATWTSSFNHEHYIETGSVGESAVNVFCNEVFVPSVVRGMNSCPVTRSGSVIWTVENGERVVTQNYQAWREGRCWTVPRSALPTFALQAEASLSTASFTVPVETGVFADGWLVLLYCSARCSLHCV